MVRHWLDNPHWPTKPRVVFFQGEKKEGGGDNGEDEEDVEDLMQDDDLEPFVDNLDVAFALERLSTKGVVFPSPGEDKSRS